MKLPFSSLPRRSLGAALLIIACALPTAPAPVVAQNLPSLGGSEARTLSPALERKLGEHIMRTVQRRPGYLNDGLLLEYLNTFGASLLAANPDAQRDAGYDFFFFAVRDSRLNAFALPGGFIGVNSGLLLAAQNESELASVLAHEIGHVSQRHIARMLGNSQQDSLIAMAGMLVAIMAAGSSPDLAQAAAAGGSGLAMQRQLNFSREAEREADRIGLQILDKGGFDSSGMVAFFERIQRAGSVYNNTAPAYLRTHPLTTERIADIQGRLQEGHPRKRTDSLDFHLMRARSRVLQDDSPQGWREATEAFNGQLQNVSVEQQIAARYGLACIALRQNAHDKAWELLQQARAMLPRLAPQARAVPLASLAIDIRLAAGDSGEALKEAQTARAQFALSRHIAVQYADALLAAGQLQEAVDYLRDQLQMYRQEPALHQRLAHAYAAQGKRTLQHIALAEHYALLHSLPAALDQLAIARSAPDASFHDHAIIDAREREFRQRWQEELKETQQRRQGR